MEVKFKKLSDKAVVPTKAHSSDAGFDLTATRVTSEVNECGQFVLVYHTDLAMEIPDGYVGLIFPRSSISKKSLYQTNAVAVIDSNYRGEIIVKYKNTTGDSIPAVYNLGDKFAQLIIMPYPAIEFVEAEELSESDRGEGGFGSTDKETNTENEAKDASTSVE
uniref:dUTP diphosphatase n=1 Tax=Podoviridae sp. ct2m58 TaxID=2827721 RepID=A0A8S5TLW5_9CAUD|nr:MAG TPA: dUTPase [Podoviridae sp. ct2m58]